MKAKKSKQEQGTEQAERGAQKNTNEVWAAVRK